MIKSYCDKIVCVRNCIKNVMIKIYGDKLFIKLYQEMYWKVTIKSYGNKSGSAKCYTQKCDYKCIIL